MFSTSELSAISADSQLMRMTTIRRVFEKFDVDINAHSLQDLYNELLNRRDLSEESLTLMYTSVINPPLQKGQLVQARVVFTIDDTYGQIDESLVTVFDSKTAETNPLVNEPIIQTLEKLNILDIVQLDRFLGINVELSLQASEISADDRPGQHQSEMSAQAIQNMGDREVDFSLPTISSNETSEEPGSPRDLSFSSIRRLSSGKK